MVSLARDIPAPLDGRQRQLHKLRNVIHTWALLGASIAILGLTAWSLFGPEGILWAAVGGGVTLWSASRVTPELILQLYRARPLPANVFAEGSEVVEALAKRAGLAATPKLYYVPSSLMNAFAVGRPGSAAIAVSDGLIRGLNLRQFAGVMAHEISHIRNGDVRVMALADMVARMTSVMQTIGFVMAVIFSPAIFGGGGAPWLGIVLLMVAPIATGLIQLALSRAREYDADLEAAGLTGDPEGLASALATLERRQGSLWERLMLPGGGRMPDASLLRTHPRTEDRIERLLSLRQPAEAPRFGGRGPSVPVISPGIIPVTGRPRMHRTGVWY